MKSKDIKLYRKVLTKVNHIDYKPIDCIPSEQLEWTYHQPKSGDDDCGDGVGGGENKSPNNGSGSSDDTAKETRTTTATSTKVVVTKGFSIEYMSSTQLQANETLLNSCLKLFEDNMKVYYENSSWGFNLEDKKEEFVHPKAKFLLLFVNGDSEDNSTVTNTGEDNTKELIGFVHFRYEWNDDDEPTHPVLYCYELHITKQYQRMKCCKKLTALAAADADNADNSSSKSDMIGLGTYMMLLLEQIAVGGALNRIQLTCFKANEGAMNFYLNKLNYVIDDISPSKWVHLDPNNSKVDYEILSKELNVLSEAKNTAAAAITKAASTTTKANKTSGKKNKKRR